MYVLEGAELVFVTTNNYFFGRQLQLDVDYMYSIVAMSCGGESTAAVSNVIVEGWLHYLVRKSLLHSFIHCISRLCIIF